jgi:hypothetical protein
VIEILNNNKSPQNGNPGNEKVKKSMESISSRLDVRKKECKGLKTRLRNYFILIAIKEK